jgi:P-type E1-E2 ATPase
VDVLRAPRVLWLDDGIRFLCGEDCRSRFLRGERRFDSPAPSPRERSHPQRPSIPDLVREATVVREGDAVADGEASGARRYDPAVATGLAVLSLVLLLATTHRQLGWLAAFLLVLCAAVNARVPLRIRQTGSSLRAVAPVGLLLAAIAGTLASDPEGQRWSLLDTAVAALAVSMRSWVHFSVLSPMRAREQELRDTLPAKARVPARDPSSYEEVPATTLRQGDLVVVLEGELVPTDGVIEEGSGLALRYPKAARSRPFTKGDFMLAGTRVLEGAVTIRVRRRARDRGMVRAVELGSRTQLEGAAASRLRFALAHWSWLPAMVASIAAWVWTGPAAGAALLLGFPLLALVGSLDIPLQAGALASARRGMFLGSSRALRDAGRVDTTAILLRGALTAGEAIVQHVHRLGGMDPATVIALAAAAEQAAEDHPIARAIRSYAQEHGLTPATVRKERVEAGLGVTAVTPHGASIVVGRRQLLLDEGISVAAADSDATHIENQGLTPIFIAIGGHVEALLAILDPIHVGARDAVQRIVDLPCDVVILSGDDRRTVERIASTLGAGRVKAPLLPHERVTEVRGLRETGGVTATIGRGGEDDAVLAASDVPISLRLMGTALEDRGLVVASRDVRDAAGALWIARAVRRSTWRTIATCLLVGVLVMVGGASGWMTPGTAALIALGTEAWTLRAGSRLLRRVDLRLPMQQ